jgi:hypothetical protein
MSKQPEPLPIGARVTHPHFEGIGRIDDLINGGIVAVVVRTDEKDLEHTFYIRAAELKPASKEPEDAA